MDVDVKTNGDTFAWLECGDVRVEFSKDGDSPACPNSWTWEMWLDGNLINSTCDETSLAEAVKDATGSIAAIMRQLRGMHDYLVAYGAFGEVDE